MLKIREEKLYVTMISSEHNDVIILKLKKIYFEIWMFNTNEFYKI